MSSNLGLGVGGVVHLLTVIPVLWFLGLWVLDLLGGQHVPVLLHAAGLHLLVVDLHFVRLVWVQDQRVQVSELVILDGWRERGQERQVRERQRQREESRKQDI